MSLLDRDPSGHFMGRSSALPTWFPELIQTCSIGDPVALTLEMLARWTGKELQRRIDWENDFQFDLWTRRWRFLRKCLEEWKAIK